MSLLKNAGSCQHCLLPAWCHKGEGRGVRSWKASNQRKEKIKTFLKLSDAAETKKEFSVFSNPTKPKASRSFRHSLSPSNMRSGAYRVLQPPSSVPGRCSALTPSSRHTHSCHCGLQLWSVSREHNTPNVLESESARAFDYPDTGRRPGMKDSESESVRRAGAEFLLRGSPAGSCVCSTRGPFQDARCWLAAPASLV